jgi:hypothetical protein
MAKLTLKTTTPLAAGGFEYTYDCDCSPKPTHAITITAANSEEAQTRAQTACDAYCAGGELATSTRIVVASTRTVVA